MYCLHEFRTFLFWSRPKKRPMSVRVFSYSATVWEFAMHNSSFPFSQHTMSLNIDIKMIRPWNYPGSHCTSVIMSWISSRIPNVVNPVNFSHSNSIGSPSIRFNSRHWDEFIKPSTCTFHVFAGCSLILAMHNMLSLRIRRLSLLTAELLGQSTVSSFSKICLANWSSDQPSCHIEQLFYCSLWLIFCWM